MEQTATKYHTLKSSLSTDKGNAKRKMKLLTLKSLSKIVADDIEAASDQGLLCLPMSLLWNARLKWVNITIYLKLK